MPAFLLLLVGLPFGCSEPPSEEEEDGDAVAAQPVDSDGDGWLDDEDCEPDNPAVNPDAVEICNGVDDDCNTEVDDDPSDAVVFYRDEDGDGFGVDEATETACARPSGFAEASGDCDDTRADAFPGAAASEPALCTVDADGDGFGSAGLSAPLEAGTDCADSDADAYPGAADEEPSLCTIDADRDGFGSGLLVAPLDAGTDCDDAERRAHPGAAEAEPLLCALDADGDGYGDDEATAPVDAGTDCDDDDRNTHPGASEASRALLQDPACDGGGVASLGDAEYVLLGRTGRDHAGQGVSALGDIDGDGLADFAVGVPGGDGESPGSGLVRVVLGATLSAAAEGEVELAALDFTLLGENDRDDAGAALSSAGDVDGDGLDDILVGAPGSQGDGTRQGAAYLILAASLPAGGGSLRLADADVRFVGAGNYDELGGDVASAGDVDGDGLGDILIGSDYEDGYLFLGSSLRVPQGTVLSAAEASYAFTDTVRNGYVGRRVAGAGDVDGDGLDDLLFGNPTANVGTAYGSGLAYLVYGSTLAASTDAVIDLGGVGLSLLGEENYDRAGSDVAAAGDVDGDGLMDILVGAYNHARVADNAGSAYVLLGSSLTRVGTGDLSLSAADHHLYGEGEADYAGWTVASAGDVDGDGLDDVAVGAYRNRATGTNAGKAYVVRGSVLAQSSTPFVPLGSADFGFEGERVGDYAGWSVSSAGDVDGDGLSDLLVGAPDASRAGWTYSGKAYLLLSRF